LASQQVFGFPLGVHLVQSFQFPGGLGYAATPLTPWLRGSGPSWGLRPQNLLYGLSLAMVPVPSPKPVTPSAAYGTTLTWPLKLKFTCTVPLLFSRRICFILLVTGRHLTSPFFLFIIKPLLSSKTQTRNCKQYNQCVW